MAINNVAIGRLQPEQIVQLLTEARQQRVTAYIRRQGSARVLAFVLTPELVDAPASTALTCLRRASGTFELPAGISRLRHNCRRPSRNWAAMN